MAPRMPEPPGGRSTVVAPSPPEQIAGRVAGAVRWWSVWRCRVSSRTDGERDEERTSGDLRGRGSGKAGGGISHGGSGEGGLRGVTTTPTAHTSCHCARPLSLRTLGFHCAHLALLRTPAFNCHDGLPTATHKHSTPRRAFNGHDLQRISRDGLPTKPRWVKHLPRRAMATHRKSKPQEAQNPPLLVHPGRPWKKGSCIGKFGVGPKNWG